MQKTIKECVDRLRSLEDNWDDEGALRIPPHVCDTLERIWNGVHGDPIAGPCADGSLDLHWPDWVACLNIQPAGEIHMSVMNPSETSVWNEHKFLHDVPVENVNAALEEVLSRAWIG